MRQIRESLDTQWEGSEVDAFNAGVKSVLYIRCMHHREVPQLNVSKLGQGECGGCTREGQRALIDVCEQVIKQLVEALNNLSPRLIGGWGGCWCDRNPDSANIVDHQSACIAARDVIIAAEPYINPKSEGK